MKKTATRDAIAAEVRAALGRHQVKQAALAEGIGISQGALSERLRGHRPFDTDQLTAIAEFLGIDLDDLLRPARSAA